MSLRKLHRSFLRFLCVILPFSETVARSASAFGRKFSLQKGSFFAEGEPFFQKKTLKVRPSKSNSDKSGKFSLKGSARTCVLAADLGCWASCVPRKPGLHRKEVIQPLVLERLPCYDFTPVAYPTFGSALLAVRLLTSGVTNSHGVTGGVYKARERIHRGMLIRDY